MRTLERAYEVGEGLTRDTDKLPKMFVDNPIKAGPLKGVVLESDKLEEMKSKYYALRGWDVKTGAPTEETLKQLGPHYAAKDMKKRGKLPAQS